MKPSTKNRLREMLSNFSSVEEKVARPPVLIEKNLDPKIKSFLSSHGMSLLNKEINTIIERQKMSMQDKKKMVEQEDFELMKKNLKIYGKNPKQYKVQKIIKIGPETGPQPLKNIIKVHENKFTIAKEHNVILSQKIDAIIQEQDIMNIKNANKEHLQSKIQAPLVRELRRFRSTHNIGSTERNPLVRAGILKRQSLWSQRGEKSFELTRFAEEKGLSLEKYRRDNVHKKTLSTNFTLRRPLNSTFEKNENEKKERNEGMKSLRIESADVTEQDLDSNKHFVPKPKLGRKLRRKGVIMQ